MINQPEYTLSYQIEELPWKTFSFIDEMTIGTRPDDDLQLEIGISSRTICQIRENPAGLFIVPLDPDTPIRLENEALELNLPAPLAFGQTVHFANVHFLVNPYQSQTTAEPEIEVIEEEMTWHEQVNSLGKKRLIQIISAILLILAIGTIVLTQIVIPILNRPGEPGKTLTAQGTETSTEEMTPTPEFNVEASESIPEAALEVTPPGIGNFSLESLSIGLEEIENLALDPDQTIQLLTKVYGDNIAFLYQYTAIIEENRLITIDLDFIRSEQVKEIDGVVYPDYPEDMPIPIDLTMKPEIHLIEDDTRSFIALLQSEHFLITNQRQTYRVDGIYQPKDSKQSYEAYLLFDQEGNLLKLVTLKNTEKDVAAPYEAALKMGDQFTLVNKEFKLLQSETQPLEIQILNDLIGQTMQPLLEEYLTSEFPEIAHPQFGPAELVTSQGETLVYGRTGFRWRNEALAAKNVVIGIAAQDYDGNYYLAYFPIKITR